MWKIISVVVLGVTLSAGAMAQASESTFTAQGIGQIHDLSMIHNNGMGGVGISSGSFWYLNNINPALLPFNTLTVFGAGFVTERRVAESNLGSSVSSGGNLDYLATALPVINGRWTTAIGIAPYSTVDYEVNTIQPFPASNGGEAILTNRGEGGFNQFYWSNGVRIGSDFYIGARGSFLFSSIIEESQNFVRDTSMVNPYIIALYNQVSVSDLLLTGGAAFSKDSLFNKNIRLNVGVTYDFAAEVDASALRILERRSNFNVAQEADTLINQDGSIYIPSAYGFGITFSQGFNWQASLEMKMQGWSDYKNFDGNNEGLSDAIKISLGGEYTPEYASVSNYFKRITYRAGLTYGLLPFTVNNNQVREVGINFGLSLPVSRFSSIDLAMRYATRGNIEETFIQEDVVRFGLGITFNDQWFIRRKYD